MREVHGLNAVNLRPTKETAYALQRCTEGRSAHQVPSLDTRVHPSMSPSGISEADVSILPRRSH